MTHDFSKVYKDRAIFLPAISEMYIRYISSTKQKRPPPGSLTNDDLNFLTNSGKLFFLPTMLYSAGQAAKSDILAQKKDILTDRKRGEVTVVGDSGGFQIETGAIEWRGEETLNRMLNWLENNCEWSMILDFPTGAISKRGQSLYTEYVFKDGKPVTYDAPVLDSDGVQELTAAGKPKFRKQRKVTQHKLDFWFCLDRTIENNDYFIANRTVGKTKFLNVLQGRSQNSSNDNFGDLDFATLPRPEQKKLLETGQISECDAWYECVKHFSDDTFGERSFEGWALAGFHKDNFSATLRRVIVLLFDGMLKDKKWMHFLGMGKVSHGCVYSDIQRGIRAHEMGNDDFTISFDASSPFSSAAFGWVSTGYSFTKNGWVIDRAKMDGREYLPGGTRGKEPLHYYATPRYDATGHFTHPDGTVYTGQAGRPVTDNNEPITVKFPLEGQISNHLVMEDLCVNTDPDLTSTWDVASYATIMNHNVYMHMDAIYKAQDLYDLPWDEAKEHVPHNLLQIKYLVRDILKMPRDEALATIAENSTILNSMAVGKSSMISTVENADLFQIAEQPFVKKKPMKAEVVKEDQLMMDLFE